MTAAAEPAPPDDRPGLSPLIAWPIVLGVGLAVWLCDVAFELRPAGVEPWGWRLLAVFVPTVLGLMLRPMPGGAVVLIGVLALVVFDAVPPAPAGEQKQKWVYEQALAGYADSSVWLVLAAYFLARGVINTGLARRIALTFVRFLGGNTLGLGYAMVGTDALLAALVPSNAARVGGVVLPITRSLAELYRSRPGPTAGLLGSFLMLTLYQCDVVACAMFYTGQASNPLAAQQAGEMSRGAVDLNYANWLLYASVPGLACLLIGPWLVYRLHPPELRETPEAVEMARDELRRQGPPGYGEIVMMVVFALVCVSWVVTGFLVGGQYITVIALGGACVLFLTGVLTWDDAISERNAWDVFIWYGGLVQMGTLIGKAKVAHVFAANIAGQFAGLNLPMLFLLLLLVYFYAHYAFASITAHVLSMFPAFAGVLLALGAPPGLVMVAFAYSANLCAGLTHYGTTPGPIIFSHHYVEQGAWWRVGLVMSAVNLTVFALVGLPWWKLWGLW